MSPLDAVELVARVLAALAFGAAIGLERQWRSGLAGIRTNALVSGGSALFVVLGAIGTIGLPGADPTRIAAQVVSGIGFLGAGVIMREGLNVRGLTTAATLWCSAAIGSLAGFGLYLLALCGTIAIIVVNTALRPVSRAISRRRAAVTEAEEAGDGARYLLEVRTHEKHEQRVKWLVLDATGSPDFTVHSLESAPKKHDEVVVRAELAVSGSTGSGGSSLEDALRRISLEPRVSSIRWWDVATAE